MSFNFEQLSFLIVDDNRQILSLIREILYGFGVQDVRTSLNTAHAFEEVKSKCPDILICDESMEPVTGVEFTRLLRTGVDSLNIHIPVIMVTGYSDYAKVCEARDAGVNEFLGKPISTKSLYLRILEIINSPRSFIRSRNFTGPDRRRADVSEYDGLERRKSRFRVQKKCGLKSNDIEFV